MTFEEAVAASNLNTALAVVSDLSPAGRPPITQPAADWAIEVSQAEKGRVSAACFSFTHLTEHSFDMSDAPMPNDNGFKQETSHRDAGRMQLNIFWTRLEIMMEMKKPAPFGILLAEFEPLSEADIFGSVFFNADLTPCGFTGSHLANGRQAMRHLFIQGHDERTRAVNYTGEAHRDKRGKLWDVLHGNFEQFFLNYTP